MYVDSELGAGWQVLIYVIGLIFFGLITYMAAKHYFQKSSDRDDTRIKQIKELIRLNKKLVKGKELGDQKYELKEKEVVENLDVKEGKESSELLTICTEMAKIHKDCTKKFKKNVTD